jgi:Holliday junction resolvase-like predicted endonuclease
VDADQAKEYGAEINEGDEDEGISEAPPLLHDASIVEDVVTRIEEGSKEWARPSMALTVDGRRWLPHLVMTDGPGVLYVHVSSSIPRYIARRLRGASEEHRIYIALRIEALYDEDVLRILADVDAEVLVIEGESKIGSAYYLAALADNSIPVTPELRRELTSRCWAQRRVGTSFQKGRHFEGLLAFLLSQVTGFRIFDRNFNGATDEIDIIVRVDAFTDACWSQSGVPFVIVEAKNWLETVGSSVVALLLRKLETRRKRARIGLLFTTSSFSPQASEEELKEAKGDLCVAMLGPHEIETWMNEDDLTGYLDDYVARAMMR